MSDEGEVRLERLILESGDSSYALDFHPRLTVIAGLAPHDRDGLVNELVGALGGGRQGVHLELVSDTGSRFAVFRPTGAPPRIVSVDSAFDVTSQFLDARGDVNLLAQASLDLVSARAAMTLVPEDLERSTDHDRVVRRVAATNQSELWISAETLRSAQARLDVETVAFESTTTTTETPDEIEQLHETHQEQRERFEQVRKISSIAAGTSAALAIPALALIGVVAIIPLAVVIVASLISTMFTWRLTSSAETAERDALVRLNAQSYLGFQLQRVNGLLDSDRGRRNLMRAAEDHREALRRWDSLGLGIDLTWLFSNRDHIDRASRLRSEVFGGEGTIDADVYERGAAMAQSMVTRLAGLRSVGQSEESFTAIFDDPFRSLEPAVIPPLLELLVRSSEHQQILLLTDNEAITSWARLEAMTGVLSLIEPIAPEIDMSAAQSAAQSAVEPAAPSTANDH